MVVNYRILLVSQAASSLLRQARSTHRYLEIAHAKILMFAPLPLLAALFVACSGSAEPEPTSPVEGESELALAADSDASSADKGRRDGDGRGSRGRGRGHHRPPPEPSGQSCEVAGETFPDGAGVPSGDTCNSCGCNDGSVTCTLALCNDPGTCTSNLELADGVCSRFPLDPCRSQDPDCDEDGGASCTAAGQTFPDGEAVPSGDSCNSCSCDDGSVACTEIGCEPVVCALFVEESDGVCSRFPLDPASRRIPTASTTAAPVRPPGRRSRTAATCPPVTSCNSCGCNDGSVLCTAVACEPGRLRAVRGSSPTASARAFRSTPACRRIPDCVDDGGSCEAAGQTFPNGSAVPSGDSCNSCGCNDGSVLCTAVACEPVFCALFVERSDGVCSRFPLDPCKSQDPDCLEPPSDPVAPQQP